MNNNNNLKVTCIHFLNNFSGSPNVLSTVAIGLVKKNVEVEIITNKSEGFLSNITEVKYSYVTYKFGRNPIIVLFYFCLCQIQMFYKILIRSKSKHIFYINTITPFAAILACWLTNRKYIIHCHENMQQRKPFYSIYRTVYKWANQKSIFVSTYVEQMAVGCKNGTVIYNGLTEEFEKRAEKYIESGVDNKKTVLMVASLRRYKGVCEFVQIAKTMDEYNFELVVSATQNEVDDFIYEVNPPTNLKISSSQNDLHPYYQRAKLLLQLSHPESCVETFGLTILEAMVYGVPSIVPNAGGPLELVADGVNGFWVDPHKIDTICSKISELMTDDILYAKFSNNAIECSKKFSNKTMIDQIYSYIH